MTFITLAFMTAVSPAHISPIVHDFDISSRSISCQSVKIERVNARVWSGENARRHIHAVAHVDQSSVVLNDRLLVIKLTVSKIEQKRKTIISGPIEFTLRIISAL